MTEMTETEVTEATEKGIKRGGAEDKEQRRNISFGFVLKYSPLLLGLRFSAFMLFSVASLISVSVPSVTSVTSVSVSPVAVR